MLNKKSFIAESFSERQFLLSQNASQERTKSWDLESEPPTAQGSLEKTKMSVVLELKGSLWKEFEEDRCMLF